MLSVVTRTDLAVPRTAEALPLVVARSRLAEVEDAGVTLGVGDPVAVLAVIPDCGCDACDSGSQDALALSLRTAIIVCLQLPLSSLLWLTARVPRSSMDRAVVS